MARRYIKTILVAVEFPRQHRQTGLARAAQLARAFGARLALVHCAYSPYARDARFAATDIEQERGGKLAEACAGLERLARPLRRRGLKVSVHAVWDYPAFEGIVREALRTRPDLVVAESHRRPFGARLFLTNNDWQLIRLCPAPLLLVKKPSKYGKARVMAAIDPLHARDRSARLDRRILELAQAIAAAHSGRLDVVHAYLPLSIAIATGTSEPLIVPVDPKIDRRHTLDVRRAMERVCAPLSLSQGQLHLEVGDPASVIPDLAKRRRADLVVMGAVSRHGLERVFIGNTAERVLDALPCDVLVVKPGRFRTTVSRRPVSSRRLFSAA